MMFASSNNFDIEKEVTGSAHISESPHPIHTKYPVST